MLDTREALSSLLDNVDALLADVDVTVRTKAAQLRVDSSGDLSEVVNNVLSGASRAKEDLRSVLEKRAERRHEKVATAIRIFKVAQRLSSCSA